MQCPWTLALALLLGCQNGTPADDGDSAVTANVAVSTTRDGAKDEEGAPALAATTPGRGGPVHRVVGLVTSVDGLDVTVSTDQGERTARLAPGKTRYFGRRGRSTSSAALRVASRVRGVVALDGTWASFELRSP